MNGRKKKVLFFQENLYREINQFYFVFSRARNALMYIQFVFRFAIVQSKKIAPTLLMQLLGYLIIEHKYIFIKTRERERKIIILLKRRQIWVVFKYISALNFDMALTKWKQSTLNLNGPQKKTFSKTHMKQKKNCIQWKKKAESTLRPIEN